MGLLRIPASFEAIKKRPDLQGITKASEQIEVTAKTERPILVYVQPKNGSEMATSGKKVISFDQFADVVDTHDDAVSKRFAASLREWAKAEAGKCAE